MRVRVAAARRHWPDASLRHSQAVASIASLAQDSGRKASSGCLARPPLPVRATQPLYVRGIECRHRRHRCCLILKHPGIGCSLSIAVYLSLQSIYQGIGCSSSKLAVYLSGIGCSLSVQDQGWQGRGGARGVGCQKAAPRAGVLGAAKFRGRSTSKTPNSVAGFESAYLGHLLVLPIRPES